MTLFRRSFIVAATAALTVSALPALAHVGLHGQPDHTGIRRTMAHFLKDRSGGAANALGIAQIEAHAAHFSLVRDVGRHHL